MTLSGIVLESNSQYQNKIEDFFKSLKYELVLDLGCGDFYFHCIYATIIVPELIEYNKKL